ncbi:Kazal domain [Phytophthora cactorum]|nr:Kazal domain [Phytophthora cactorum]
MKSAVLFTLLAVAVAAAQDQVTHFINDGSTRQETPRKKCSSGCPDVELPVCGSDGVRYGNPCELKIAACKHPELNIVEAAGVACSKSKKCWLAGRIVVQTERSSPYRLPSKRRSVCLQSVQEDGRADDTIGPAVAPSPHLWIPVR